MKQADLPQVLHIERAAYTHPWTPDMFHDCFTAGYQCILMEYKEKIIGYAILMIVLDEAHTFNLCVHPSWQGQGFGRLLLQHTLDLSRSLGAETAFLEVRSSNTAARQLYITMGFNEIGVRKNYYPLRQHQREDAVVLAMELAVMNGMACGDASVG